MYKRLSSSAFICRVSSGNITTDSTTASVCFIVPDSLSLHLSLYQCSSFFHLQQLSNIFQYNSVAHLNSLIDSIKHVNIDLIEYTSAYDNNGLETAEQPVSKSLIFYF